MKATRKFFKKVTVQTTSCKYENVLMYTSGTRAYVYSDITGNEIVQYASPNKYSLLANKFKIELAEEISEDLFDAYLKIRCAHLDANRLAAQKKSEKQNEELKLKIAEIEKDFESKLTQEKIQKWTSEGANEGNSQTRRTRWNNRASRLGHNAWGGVLRDLVYKLAQRNPVHA